MDAVTRTRCRISPQQRTMLKALGIWREARPQGGCKSGNLYLALYGEIPPLLCNQTEYYSMCRSLDRLVSRGLVEKKRAHWSKTTKHGWSTGMHAPRFSITAAGLDYLQQADQVEPPHARYHALLDLHPDDYSGRHKLLGRYYRD